MALSTKAKDQINRLLRPLNVRLDTLTAEAAEQTRLRRLESTGHFDRPVFPILDSFESAAPRAVMESLSQYEDRFATLEDASHNDVGFSFGNEYYPSPDAEVLYALTRQRRPKRIVEVGSGNSTKLFRQAIKDGGLQTHLLCIDPNPRTDIKSFADEFLARNVETVLPHEVFAALQSDDFLFIDSSHDIKARNDVVFLFLEVLPMLARGVIVHVHDIFLPYEYPRKWLLENNWSWNEQYLLQALLAPPSGFEVLWPGHYLQRTNSRFERYFPRATGRAAASFWMRKVSGPKEL